MTLSDLGAVGAFVSGLAVVASLIYLSLQVRQASKHQRSQLLQGRTQANIDMRMRFADPAFALVWDKVLGSGDDLTLSEYRQVRNVCIAGFFRDEEAFLQHREGLISEAAFDGVRRTAVTMFMFPRPRVAWKQARPGFDQEFTQLMDRILEETDLIDTPASLAEFNQQVVEEIRSRRAVPYERKDEIAARVR